MNLDANDLILFAHLIDAGSFAKAADRIGLPKSTLSRRMTILESTLGEKLVVRTTRRLEITEFGERILEHARRLLEETEATADLAQHEQAQPRGLLRVSMPPDFVDLDLAGVLIQFASLYPEVRLELDLSPRRVDLVAERFDLALRVATKLPDDALLVARKLTDLQIHLYASPAYLDRHGLPTSPDDLMNHICLKQMSSSGEVVPWTLSSSKHDIWEGMPSGSLSSNSPKLQRELAIHGLGIAGISDHFITKDVEHGLLVRILPDWSLPQHTIWCMTPGKRLLPQRTLAFIEILKAKLGSFTQN